MAGHDVIVIGASAGGVQALSDLVASLPADLPAAVLVVVHFPSHRGSVLPGILSRAGALPAKHPHQGETIEHGHIYVAPPDQHMLVEEAPDGECGRIRLVRGPRQNMHRPSIDPLFRTAARVCGGRITGVILSGTLDDGTSGIRAVKKCGGLAVVQDPNDALYASMPLSAIENAKIDYVLPLSEIPATLARLAVQPAEETRCNEPEALLDVMTDTEIEYEEQEASSLKEHGSNSHGTLLTCPECGGVLREIDDGRLIHYRCHVGHSFSVESLVEEQSSIVEKALWTAVRSLEERASLAQRMAKKARQSKRKLSASHFETLAGEAE
jgi:two-component system chemotaxis response regulator CheB